MDIRLDPSIEARLKTLASQTGRTADAFVLQAIQNYLEDVEDVVRAKQALSANEKEWTLDEIEKELGFKN